MLKKCWPVLILLALWPWADKRAMAQTPAITWSRPANLSGTPSASAHPAIVADAYGYVHVFWSEEYGGHAMQPDEHIANTGNTIFYTRWDGVSWLPPIDIQLVPGEPLAEFPAVAVDADNTLYLVWVSMSRVYFSQAPSWDAHLSRAWSEPVAVADDMDATPWAADVAVDASGGLHIIYAGRDDGVGVYYLRPSDGGKMWHPPVKLSAPPARLEEEFSMLQIVADSAGRLHTVWGANQRGGAGEAVYYTRSVDGGDSWSAPLQLAGRDAQEFFTGVPYLQVRGGSELHLIYVDGAVTGSLGRYHRISYDGGVTWSEPYHIIPELMGMNGRVEPVVDAAGGLHLIANMRTFSTQVVGIYYARWLNRGWLPASAIDVSIPSAHYTATAVRLGNEIHLVYTQLEGGEIWHVWGAIPTVPQRAPRPLPSLVLAAPFPEPAVDPSPAAWTSAQPTADPPAAGLPLAPAGDSGVAFVLGSPLLSAAALSLALVGSVVAWQRLRPRVPR